MTRAYLVIMDDTGESRVALRFAARRAAKTGGGVQLLALVAKPVFVALGGVQATIEEEARAQAEVLLIDAASQVEAEGAPAPATTVRQGDDIKVVTDYLAEHPEVAALVLSAAPDGGPGPLVSHFAGAGAGRLPCPLFIVPGSLSDADIDRLS